MTTKRTTPSTQLPDASVEMPNESTRPANADAFAAEHAEPPALFPLGRVVATPGAIDFMERNAISPAVLLEHHQAGDWGDVCAEDAQENVLSVQQGFRVLSAYRYGPAQEAIWVITEADRSVTTLLLPSEY